MKLYVGNISYDARDEDLKSHFETVGPVESATVLMDKMTGRSRGFGFVEMSDADGQKAIEELDGKELNGRELRVNEARPMKPRE